MSKHTPGPWRAEFVGINDDFNNPTEVYEINTADGQRRICEYATAADARLIAAAPELLAVLRDAVARSEQIESEYGNGRDEEQQALYERARAAVAKATEGEK